MRETGHRQLAERQPDVPPEVRVRAAQPGRLDVEWPWVRLGIQQTPVVDFEEAMYRYRFQGTIFADREGFLSSSDFGASFRTPFPRTTATCTLASTTARATRGRGQRPEGVSDSGARCARCPGPATKRGLRAHGLLRRRHYVKDAERRRFETIVTFEHKYVNAAGPISTPTTRPRAGSPRRGRPRLFDVGDATLDDRVRGAVRYDHLEPNERRQHAGADRRHRLLADHAPRCRRRSCSITSRWSYRRFLPARPPRSGLRCTRS